MGEDPCEMGKELEKLLIAYEKSEIFVVPKKWGNAHGGKGDRI